MNSKRSATYWLAAERVIAVLAGLLTTFIVARFMGLEDFGIFAFSFAAIGLGLAAGQLGMDSLLVRSFVHSDWTEAEIIGTAITVKAAANLIGFALVFWVVTISTEAGDAELTIVMLGASVFVLSSATTVLGPWFRARQDFRSLFEIRLLATAVSLVAKVAVVTSGLSIVMMAAAHILYFVVETIILIVLHQKRNGVAMQCWAFQRDAARELLSRGLPLFLGTLIAVTYMNIDMIMLRFFWDARVVGEYALIPQVLNAIQIIPYSITSAAFPLLLGLIRDGSSDKAVILCRRTYFELLVLSSFTVVFVIFVLRPIMPLVFGPAYEATLMPLLISAFAIPFIFIRHLNTKIIVAYDIGYDFLKMEVAGLLINVFLNLILIPSYGGSGAAFATVVAYLTSTVLMLCILGKSRAIFLPIILSRTDTSVSCSIWKR